MAELSDEDRKTLEALRGTRLYLWGMQELQLPCEHEHCKLVPDGDGSSIRVCEDCGAAQYNDGTWAE